MISNTENAVLMSRARESLRGKWGLAIGTLFVYMLIMGGIPRLLHKPGGGLVLVIGGPMAVGLAVFALALVRKGEARFGQLFAGFGCFGTALGAYLLQLLFISLWTLLLIVPGIMAALSYSLTYYVLADDESIGPLQAITKSKELMYGNRWKLLCLGFRFLGWLLLCILTLGIGLLWLMPYMAVSYAQFYEDIKKTAEAAAPAPAPILPA